MDTLPAAIDHKTRTHARYAPSAAERWFACPGSVRLCEKTPRPPSSVWADRGTAAHELLQRALQDKERDAGFYFGWTFGPISIDDEICFSVQACLDHVYEILDTDPNADLYVESRIICPQSAVPQDDCAGTGDIAIYLPLEKTLHVIDFKHGVERVPVQDNKQLWLYASGRIRTIQGGLVGVFLTIVQPRAFYAAEKAVRRQYVFPVQLLEFEYETTKAILACESPDAPLVPNPAAQCRWCEAKHDCPALRRSGLSIVGLDLEDMKNISTITLPQPEAMTPEQIAHILDGLPYLKMWSDAIERLAHAMLENGKEVPGYKLVEARERRVWFGEPPDIAEQLMTVGDFDIDEVFPRKLKNLTTVEKLLKEKLRAVYKTTAAKNKASQVATKTMAELTVKESSGNLALVKESDKRPAIDPARRIADIDLPQIEAPKGTAS